MKIRIMRSWEKQEPARVQHMENMRQVKIAERRLLNKLYLRHTSKKAHLHVKVSRSVVYYDEFAIMTGEQLERLKDISMKPSSYRVEMFGHAGLRNR